MSALHASVAADLKLRDSQMHEITPHSVKLGAAIILLKRAELLARETFT